MASNADNVAQFPTRTEERRPILSFCDGYLESMYYRDEWRSMARKLATWPAEYVSPRMHQFVLEMMAREKPPTIRQLSTLVGLMVTCSAQMHFEKLAEADNPANVSQIKK